MLTKKSRIMNSLNSIKSFYDRVNKSIGDDLTKIEELNESGEYPEYEDYESAWDTPVYHLELVRKLTYIELNIYIEDQLKGIATQPWNNSGKNKPLFDYLYESKNILEDIKKYKDVNDLQVSQIIKLIEEYYKIDLSSFPKYELICEVRELANSYKHNRGYKQFKKIKDLNQNIIQLFELDEEKLFDAFEGTKEFLIALIDAVEQNSVKK